MKLKVPVGGGNELSELFGQSLIHSNESFKWLIHSETKQVMFCPKLQPKHLWFSIPVPPPPCIFFMSLFVNTPDSDNQLVRSALLAWTVFRLTCSLHSVHCSLLPEQEIRWSLLHFGTFSNGFELRNVFTHGRVWHNIPLEIYTI